MQQHAHHIDVAAAWDTSGRAQRLGAARAANLLAAAAARAEGRAD
jgi:hypothetical protein